MAKVVLVAAAACFMAACTGNSLQVQGSAQPVAVSFTACRPCHATPAPMTAVFDADHPDDFRADVRRMLTEEKTAHPYQPDQEQWNALMIWSDLKD